jgi:hypothetical protein
MTVRPTPNLAWRLFALTGIGAMAALVLSDDVWERWEDTVGDVVPRSTIRAVLTGTAGVHLLEALLVHRAAKRHGVSHPLRWTFSTLLYGFPVMFRVRRAGKAAGTEAEVEALAAAA